MSISVKIKQGELNTKSVVNSAVQKLALKTQAQAKALTPVDTGKLRASIDVTNNETREESRVGTNTGYAPYVEDKQPFLRAALKIVIAGKLPADVKNAVNNVIKKSLARKKTRTIK